MLVDLVHPPLDYSLFMPEMGVPLLTAVLRRAGHDVRQADLNVEFIVHELGNLDTFKRQFERFKPPDREQWQVLQQDREALLRYVAEQLCRVRGRPLPSADSVLGPIYDAERRAQKSCHLRAHQVLYDWQDQFQRMGGAAGARGPEHAALEALALQGGRDPHFRSSLLRVLYHYGLSPRTFFAEDVLDEVDEQESFWQPFFGARLGQLFATGQPKVFGVSIWSSRQLIPALVLARQVKRMVPDVFLVAGGAWCSYAGTLPLDVPELFEFFDAFVVHEADRALVELLDAIEQGASIEALPNVVVPGLRRGVELSVQPPTPFDELPMPVYDGFPIGLYPAPYLPLRLNRGCYWGRCTFCSHVCHPYNKSHAFERGTLLSSGYLERLAEHVRDAKQRYGVTDFVLADNLIPPGIMMQLCDLNREAGLGIRWSALARFEPDYTGPFCTALAEGGCSRLELGLEAAGDTELRRLKKGITMATVVEGLNNLRAAGVDASVFVLNYPGQDEASFEATLDFLSEHREQLAGVSLARFHLARNTPAYLAPDTMQIAPSPDAGRYLDVFGLPFEAAHELADDRVAALAGRYFPNFAVGDYALTSKDGRGDGGK